VEAVRFDINVLDFDFNAAPTIRYLQFKPCRPAEYSSDLIVVETASAS
jgi:hypothetical protein